MDVRLQQAHRAGLEFLGATQKFTGGVLQSDARREYLNAVPEAPTGLDERRASVARVLADSPAWAFDRFITRWVAEEVYVRALPAVESIRPTVEAWLASPEQQLEVDPDVVPPSYWENEFHLTPGGWNGHDLMGPAITELVFHYVLVPGGVGAVRTGQARKDHRATVAGAGRRDSYRRIVEFGASSGRYTFALANTYPESPITAIDLAVSSLRHGIATARARGIDTIEWLHADIERTQLPDGAADLVTMFSLLHEVPDTGAEAILAEAFRLLEPGGEFLLGEVAPYDRHPAFDAVVLDWETENRGEPYWREALGRDLVGMLERVGFTEVTSYGASGGVFPWITHAVKPTESHQDRSTCQ
ncbi:class I SAM-dependent methyltransferase [Rhodococcus sp. NPDC047139]|uniref:class I SAM-dependent methyltransferase n=1 Tax=Rhodococcus sp. NPDC047139 TaxID=3155141 RepID=UPI0033DBEE0A